MAEKHSRPQRLVLEHQDDSIPTASGSHPSPNIAPPSEEVLTGELLPDLDRPWKWSRAGMREYLGVTGDRDE